MRTFLFVADLLAAHALLRSTPNAAPTRSALLAVEDEPAPNSTEPRSKKPKDPATIQEEAAKKLQPLGEDVHVKGDQQTPKLPFVSDDLRSCTGHFKVGCFGDEAQQTRTWYHKVVPEKDRKKMSTKVCFEFCQQVPFSQFFGLVRGRECWCSPFYDKRGTTDGFCDLPCEGNADDMCGGDKLSTVHEMHDCNNLPAKRCHGAPPPISNAAKMCSWGDTAAHSYCAIECIPGFEVGKNEIRCKEFGDRLVFSWASWVGTATCIPKNCGAPSEEPHSRHPTADVIFPNAVQFQCQLGFSLDQAALGNRTFSQECQTTGQLSPSQPCMPVKCGKAPVFTNACRKRHVVVERGVLQNITAEYCPTDPADLTARDLVFQDVAQYECVKGYTTNAVASGPKSVQATCTATGEFSEPPACRAVICGAAPTTPHGLVTGPLAKTPEALVRYPTAVPYKCLKGYTLDGSPRYVPDNTEFSRKCTHRGTFSRAFGTCKPVECGMPPDIHHAQVQKTYLKFSQQAVYTCAEGHTTDGEPTGARTITLTCGEQATFEKEDGIEQIMSPAKCIAVSCGEPLKIDHAKVARGAGVGGGVSRFPETMVYTAEMGYSTVANDNPADRQKASFQVTCQANGQFSPAPALVNINDCLVHNCGVHGACRDVEEPTNNPENNYVCDCHDGYETQLNVNGEKRCRNINDCPARHGCYDHGSCTDLLKSYKCECDEGFEQVPESQEGNVTCAPIICGVPEAASNTSHKFHAIVEYPGSAAKQPEEGVAWAGTEVKYSCAEGYTLDGTARGASKFTVLCQNTGAFSPREDRCQPVSCGSPPQKANAQYSGSAKDVLFVGAVGNIQYTCESGYSLTAEAGGPAVFEMSCEADGTVKCRTEDGCDCMPVRCPAVPEVAEATEVGCDDRCGAARVFPEVITYQCSEGWSTNGNAGNPAVQQFTVSCQGDGHYSALESCQRVSCGVPPAAAYQTRGESASESAVYGDELTYSCDEGYSLDTKASGPRKYGVSCEADGNFSPTQVCLPVNCGSPPAVEHATVPSAEVSFGHKATYTCESGYSTDGLANGDSSFTRGCTADGNFAEGPTCKAISCGPLTAPDHSELSATGDVVYTETVTVTCKPGYTLTGLPNGKVSAVVTCQAPGTTEKRSAWDGLEGGEGFPPGEGPPQGESAPTKRLFLLEGGQYGPFSPSPQCLNIDDCSPFGVTCGTHGTCVDNPEPTGDHDQDYHCECESGFEERVGDDGKKICGNKPDCPPNACQPGTCRDLVNDYTCECPAGYHEVKEGKKRDCMPNVCGTVPVVKNAAASRSGQLAFPDTVTYTCNPGYTIDGAATGATKFDRSCQADKSFSNMEMACMPISCGPAPVVGNATKGVGPKMMTFGTTNSYTCNEGWSLDGEPAGDKSFQVKCEKTGRVSGVLMCKRVVCSTFPSVANAKFSSAPVKFGDVVIGSCLKGFSTTPTSKGGREFNLTCSATGEMTPAEVHCRKVQCNEDSVPEVAHSHSACSYHESPNRAIVKAGRASAVPTLAAARARCASLGAVCVGINFVENQYFAMVHPAGEAVVEGAAGTTAYVKEHCGAQQLLGCFFDNGGLLETKKRDSGDHIELSEARKLCAESRFVGIRGNNEVHCGDTYEKAAIATDCSCEGNRDVFNHGRTCVYTVEEVHRVPLNYTQMAEFTCAPGFSLDGSALGARVLQSKCMADGSHAKVASECQPVTCGPAPVVANSMPVEGPPALKFGESVTFECQKGYSLGGVGPKGHVHTTVTGKACKRWNSTRPMYKKSAADAHYERGCSGKATWQRSLGVYSADFPKSVTGLGVDSTVRTLEQSKLQCLANPHCKAVTCAAGSVSACTLRASRSLAASLSGEETYVARVEACTGEGVEEGEKPIFGAGVNRCGGWAMWTKSRGMYSAHYAKLPEGGDDSRSRPLSTAQADCLANPTCAAVTCDNGGTSRCTLRASHELRRSGGGEDSYTPAGARNFCVAADSDTEEFCQPLLDNDKTTFTATCGPQGTFVDLRQCLPVQCGAAPELPNTKFANALRSYVFGEGAWYVCEDGYSLDGKASGEKRFQRACGDNGEFEEHKGCKKIDFCEGNMCGSNGDCINQALDYACDCHDGFEATAAGPGHQKCIEINECVEDHGAEKCGEEKGTGTCEDGVNGYTCVCSAGYEAEKSESGGEGCSAKVCGTVSAVGNASTPIPTLGTKISFPDTIQYTCAAGYSTDGKPDGPKGWTVKCTDAGEFHGQEECKPVECGSPKHVDNAVFLEDMLTFGEMVSYQCKEGFTVDGSATGSRVFTSRCLGDGSFSEVPPCMPVLCGQPPNIAFTTVNDSVKIYGDTAQFTCAEGYTLSGESDGDTQFELRCSAAGEFWSAVWDAVAAENCTTEKSERGDTGVCKFPFVHGGQVHKTCTEGGGVSPGLWCHSDKSPNDGYAWGVCTKKCVESMRKAKMPSCQAVACGAPEEVENAEAFVPINLRYKEQIQISCKAGHTLDGTATGNSSFIRKCKASGKLSENYSCKPVDCGTPLPTIHAEPKDTGKKYLYGEEAVFKCNHGYSTDGLPSGGFVCDIVDVDKATCDASVEHGTTKTFLKRCDSGGSFVAGTPGECLPIDFCQPLNPCGRNGNCTATFNEDESPKGYKCNCMEGYEAKKDDNGILTCGEDDCAGHTCGQGGSCINLKDDYTCECMAGYTMIVTEEGEKTCRRKACGRDLERGDLRPPQVLNSTRSVTRAETTSKTVVVPNPKDTLFVGDVAVYTCDEGFSTDGSAAEAHKIFAVSCQDTGMFAGLQNCIRVTCDQSKLPTVADSVTDQGLTTLFSYGDKVRYTCAPGTTVDGTAEAPNSFIVTCGADGKFDTPESCQPIMCGACSDLPDDKKTSATCPQGNLYAGEAKTLTCLTGYALPNGENTYDVSCDLGGRFVYPEFHTCSPSSCGPPPSYENAIIVRADEKSYLDVGESIEPMGQLTSEDGRFYAILGKDGKFALFDGVLWGEGFGGELWNVNHGPAARLVLTDSKKLQLQTPEGTAIWNVGSSELPGTPQLQLTTNGALELHYRKATGSVIGWTSGTGTRDRISAGEELRHWGRLTSTNGQYWVIFQTDGNLVVYSRRQKKSFWDSQTAGSNAVVARFKDGGMRVCGSEDCGASLWKTPNSKRGAFMIMQNDGNLVIYAEDGSPVWATNSFGAPALIQVKRLFGRARAVNPCAGRTAANFCFGHGEPTVVGAQCTCSCAKGYGNDHCNRAVFKERPLVLFEGKELEALTATLEQCTAACMDKVGCHSFTFSAEDNSCSLRDKCVSPSEGSATEPGPFTTHYMPCGFLTESVRYACVKGSTTTGGATGLNTFSITCNDDGYSAGAPCQVVQYTVSGWVNDAPTGRDIVGARVCAGTICGETNAAGIYSISLPAGSATLTAVAEGYINYEIVVRVTGNIEPYQDADVAMVPVMPDDDMRFVLTWNSQPSDLDSHTFYGDETQMCHACWYNQQAGYCRRSGDVTAALERDFTMGYGPEVTYVRHVGHCTNPHKNKHCRLQFKVKDYSKYYREAVGMGDSGAKVKVYRGDAKVGEYDVPRGVGNAWWWTVATVDLSTGKVFQGDANIEDPANAFVGPGAEWVVPEGKYTLKTPAGVAVQQEGNPVVRLRAEEPASKPGYYTVRSGTQCLNKEGKFADDCPPITLGVDGITARNSCVAPSVWMRMTYSACVASVTVAGAALMDSFAGDYADTSPDTLGWCPMIPCGAGKFRIAGSGKCPHVTEIVATPSGCAKMGGLMVDDVFCQMSLCESDPEGAESYALASASQCKPEDQQGAVGIDAQSTDMPYVLCSGAIEKSYKDNLFQILPLAGPNKVQVRNIATNRCLQASGDRIETTYCQFEDDEPLEEGRQWSYVNVPSVQTFRVFPEEAGAFL
mmetsp:Transcript_8338/g.20592  ORF Transcript_8338/g.20592 Transcript_8338/m.20592 type:complete len:3882 (-) Transcript_8338:103-11748(-)